MLVRRFSVIFIINVCEYLFYVCIEYLFNVEIFKCIHFKVLHVIVLRNLTCLFIGNLSRLFSIFVSSYEKLLENRISTVDLEEHFLPVEGLFECLFAITQVNYSDIARYIFLIACV